MLDTIGRINQSIISEDRINTLRNQREQIRERLKNPGLYPEATQQQQAPTNLQQLQTQYRPSGALVKKTLQDVFNQSSSGNSGEYDSTGDTGRVGGLGFSKGVSDIGGLIAGMAAGRYGAGPASGFIGSVVSGLLGDRDPSRNIASAAVKSALGFAAPALMAKYGLVMGLSGLMGKAFGFNPATELQSYFNIGNQFEPGFGYVPGMQTIQGDDPESMPGLESGQSFVGGFEGMSPETSYSDLSGLGGYSGYGGGADGDGSGGGYSGGSGEGPGANGGEDGGASDGNSW